MTWKPRHEAHAIERVRGQFLFNEPVPSKVLNRSIAETIEVADELGFDTIAPADSGVALISLQPNVSPQQGPPISKGKVMRRHDEGELVEEVGFRDIRFGYLTTTYGRWENLRNRLNEVLLPALNRADESVELSSAKLEYWDSFTFEGEPDAASVADLLEPFDGGLPRSVLEGGSTWHSHVGWFEGEKSSPTLVNRNLDLVERTNEEDGSKTRALGIYTLAERRSTSEPLEIGAVSDILVEIHKISLRMLGEAITDKYRKLIGIDLSDYQ